MKFDDWIGKNPYKRNELLKKLNKKERGELINLVTESYLRLYSYHRANLWKVRNNRRRLLKIRKQIDFMLKHPDSVK